MDRLDIVKQANVLRPPAGAEPGPACGSCRARRPPSAPSATGAATSSPGTARSGPGRGWLIRPRRALAAASSRWPARRACSASAWTGGAASVTSDGASWSRPTRSAASPVDRTGGALASVSGPFAPRAGVAPPGVLTRRLAAGQTGLRRNGEGTLRVEGAFRIAGADYRTSWPGCGSSGTAARSAGIEPSLPAW
jgi:hypothetical protein